MNNCNAILVHMDKSLDNSAVDFKVHFLEAGGSKAFATTAQTINDISNEGDFKQKLTEKLNEWANAVFILMSNNVVDFMNNRVSSALPPPFSENQEVTHEVFQKFFDERKNKLYLVYLMEGECKKEGVLPDCLRNCPAIEVSLKKLEKKDRPKRYKGYKEVQKRLGSHAN